MSETRRTIITKERIHFENGQQLARPITRIAGLAIISNPFAGQFQEDLSLLFERGGKIGEQLVSEITAELEYPVVSYGKAAIVGTAGEMEHGGACVHPMLGKPMRAAIGGGEAVIPSNVKIGAAGASIDVPLGHKDNVWSFDHFDTMTVSALSGPRPDEIVVILAFADGGRPLPRCGSGPQ